GISRPATGLLNAAAFLAGNPVNFPHLASVGPLYDKPVSRPKRSFQQRFQVLDSSGRRYWRLAEPKTVSEKAALSSALSWIKNRRPVICFAEPLPKYRVSGSDILILAVS